MIAVTLESGQIRGRFGQIQSNETSNRVNCYILMLPAADSDISEKVWEQNKPNSVDKPTPLPHVTH